MSFAAAMSRANASVFRHLANARATFDGRSFDVLFRTPYSAGINGMMESSSPQAQALTSDLPGIVQGDTLHIGTALQGTTWRVGNVLPDGTGLTTLVLEAA